MQLIAVVTGASTKDDRNAAAKALLDYGFASFSLCQSERELLEECPVIRGTKDSVALYKSPVSYIVKKQDKDKVETEYTIPESLIAPIKEGDKVGEVVYKCDGE